MKTIFIGIICCLFFRGVAAQSDSIALETATGKIRGTLMTPAGSKTSPLVLFIAGSGPTDRDGNNPVMKNNSNVLLALELQKHGIASVRYDKRGIGKSVKLTSELDIRFDDYVNDAVEWIKLLKKDPRFSKVIVLGHSEGSLIGMTALNLMKADGFISLAGAGRPAAEILKEQLKSQPAWVVDASYPILDSLVAGKVFKNVDPRLNSLFRPEIQPYMISWFKYNPQTEIRKLTIPILILQGTTDIQVSVDDAKLLSVSNPWAQLKLIENMNHVLKIAEADKQKNMATYYQPDLPVASGLVNDIVNFISGIK